MKKPKPSGMEARIRAAMRGRSKAPMTEQELARRIGVRKSQKQLFDRTVRDLIARNLLVEAGGRLLFLDQPALVPAEIVKVTATFGFAHPDGSDHDVFIPGRRLEGAMPGDRVLLRTTVRASAKNLTEGEVIRITEEAPVQFSGVLTITPSECSILPDSLVRFPISVNSATLSGAKHGDKVVAVLEKRGNRHSEHIARVLETYGSSEYAGACCSAILAAHNIQAEFPDEVLEQAQAIASGEGIHPKEIQARLDLRDRIIFTIDGADSKDLDDAVSLSRTESGWELGVHIADVSYYVTHNSPLDQEAFHRGTSVYYADSVVPMLPAELSNGICSLNPGEDRLAFSAIMTLNQIGELQKYRFEKTVIHSRVKGIYGEINAILDKTADAGLNEKYREVLPQLMEMQELARILENRRFARGGINLDTVESKIILDEQGRAIDIKPRDRGISERIIEEFMLLANEAAATLALSRALPFVFRVHEEPATDRLQNLYDVLDTLGIAFERKQEDLPTQLADILKKVRGTESDQIINTLVLRSMAKAKYASNNIGHFGLALKNYTHFTSPIRRYPDLTIHRILSGFVTGMRMDNIQKRYTGFVDQSASRSTDREIAAMQAERSCEDCYKAEYMRGRIGDTFDGIVSGTTGHGIYVRLENTVEGMVSLTGLPGEWEYDGLVCVVERQTGKRYRLGDKMRIVVAGADVNAGRIDFNVVEA